MAETNDLSKAKQIRNLLAVVGSAVGLAFLAMFLMLYSYGPAGTYLAKNVLLSPESAKALYFNDSNPQTGANSRFVFDLIEFSYYDGMQKKKREIEIMTYAKLYELIGNDTSLFDGAEKAGDAFNATPARLVFKVRADGHLMEGTSKILSETDFVGDFYRISLRGQGSDTQWIYFKHVGILEKVLELFASS